MVKDRSSIASIEFGELVIIRKHYKNDEGGAAFEDLNNSDNLESIIIEKDIQLTIGRLDSSSIVIDHNAVSGVHCHIWSIQFDETSIPLVYLKDLSLNGTFVNGFKVGKNQTWLLNHGDVITIKYGVTLKFISSYSEDELNYDKSLIQSNNIQTRFSEWTVKERILGNGTFGNVFVCERNIDRKLCAVKIIKNVTESASFESKILSKLSHPNIIKVYGAEIIRSRLYIFEDLICGGDLFSYLANGNTLTSIPEFEALVITYQIAQALKFLHQSHIVHRDLKLDNILLDCPEPFTRVVLADFGIAKSTTSTKRRMFTTVGTPEYCAPEVGFEFTNILKNLKTPLLGTLTTRKGYDSKCDIWSLGIIVHIMLSGISPFYGDGDEITIIKNAKRGKLNLKSRQWERITESAKNLVQCLLYVDMSQRLNVKECLEHDWIKRHEIELSKIYQKIIANSR